MVTPSAQISNLQQNPASTIDYNKTHHKQKTGKKAMEKFREVIMKLAETCPNGPLNPAHKTLLQDRLNRFFSEYKTPDHPPYSAMIERALSELNEKKGSTKDEISQFIIKQYAALPWAHSTLLEHHLELLGNSGDIVETRGKRYMLVRENAFLASSTKGKKKRKRKLNLAWERDGKKKRKKRHQPKGNRVECIKERKESDEKLTENGVNSEGKKNKVMVAVHEMEHSRDMPQKCEIDPSEIMLSHICVAGKEEKQVEKQANDHQPEVSSPEMPPGFELTVVENLSNPGILLRNCLSSQKQSNVVDEREFINAPSTFKKIYMPGDPSVHDLSKSEYSEKKCSSEAPKMAGPVNDGNPQSVEVHETVASTSFASDRRCNNSMPPNEEAVPNVQVPRCQSGMLPASAEESSASKCMERKQRCWSICSPEVVNFTAPGTSLRSGDHQLSQLKLSDVEIPQDKREESTSFPNPKQDLLTVKERSELVEAMEKVQSVLIESKSKEIKVYGRRMKTRPEQSQDMFQLVPMKSDVNLFESNATADSQNSFMNEHGPQELLAQPPLLQGKILQDTSSHDGVANLIDVLQPMHYPEECQKPAPKHRGRPPKDKSVVGTCKISSPSLRK